MEETTNYVGVVLVWILIAAVVFWLVWYYATRRSRWYVLGATFIGWLFPFSIIYLLPLDMTSTIYSKCLTEKKPDDCDPPLLFVSDAFLFAAWRTLYWIMFCLTWFTLPMVRGYVDSGYFTPWERFKKAVRSNFIYYLSLGAVGVVVLAWIMIKYGPDKDVLLGFVMALANLWGLSLVVVFMAYGLIELPRSLWHLGDRRRTLKYLAFRAPKVKDGLNDAELDLSNNAKRVRFHDDLRPYVDKLQQQGEPEPEGAGEGSSEYQDLDVVKLAKLHKQIIRAIRTKVNEWDRLCQRAFRLQDIVANENNPDISIFTHVSTKNWRELKAVLEFFWFVKVQTYAIRLLAILCAAMTAVIIWSETTYMVPEPMLSVVGIVFHAVGIANAMIELLSFGFLTYMCSCSMFSLFKVRVFDSFSLHPNHQTTDVSLCFFAGYMCKLTFPLCYNFMMMAVNKDTVFSQLMGDMNLSPVLGDKFQFYVPILIVIICFLNLFDIIGRALRACGLKDDLFADDEDKDGAWGDVEDGKILLAEARLRNERQGRGSITALRRDSTTALISDRPSFDPPRASKPSAFSADPDKPLSNYKASNPLYHKYAQKLGGRARNDGGADAPSDSRPVNVAGASGTSSGGAASKQRNLFSFDNNMWDKQ